MPSIVFPWIFLGISLVSLWYQISSLENHTDHVIIQYAPCPNTHSGQFMIASSSSLSPRLFLSSLFNQPFEPSELSDEFFESPYVCQEGELDRPPGPVRGGRNSLAMRVDEGLLLEKD